MKKYQGVSVSSGLVLGQVSLISKSNRDRTSINRNPQNPEKEMQLLEDAIRTAQSELESMANRADASEQAIFWFQSMLLEDESFLNEVHSYIQAGTGAAEAMNRVGQRYADKLLAMTDNTYLRLRNVDILDATQRVINILCDRPRMRLTLDHPVILAADQLMPSDLFSIPAGMILGIITSEGSALSHAAIIARARKIPSLVQVGRDFLNDCDGRMMVLDADRLMPSDLFSVPAGMIMGVITSEGSAQSHAAILARARNIPGLVQVGRYFLNDCDGRMMEIGRASCRERV